ncbi:MAG: DUF1273 family protein [Alistipes indistinctus]|nr:DUF1273 family protein [Alistipes indistinctus]
MMLRCAGICGRFPQNRIPDKDIQKRLSDTVMDCYIGGIKHIVTGISGEFEQMAVKVVSELKAVMTDMRLTVVMTPCECSGYTRYLSGRGSERIVWKYLKNADDLRTVEQDSRLTDYTQKNRYIVECSARLICCYRPLSIREAETRHLVSLAEDKPELKIINLYEPL